MDQLRTQMIQIQSELDAIRSAAEATSPKTENQLKAVPATTQAEAIPNPEPLVPIGKSRQQRAALGKQTQNYETFSEDPFAAARLFNAPLDPKYSGYFVIPGTQTLMRVGGYFKSDFIYDLKPAGNTDEFVLSSMPIPSIASSQNANQSVRASRIAIDFHIPQGAAGDVRTYLEMDFFGTNATTPRLRHAYAQLSNVLIGQTFTNFMNPDAIPDTLDFQGPNAEINVRNPQIRYGIPLGGGTSLFVAVEKPSSDIAYLYQGKPTPVTSAPDGTIRLHYEGERGHVQLTSALRDLSVQLPSGQKQSVLGWGLSVSGLVRAHGKDNLTFQAAYGRGISRYINDTSGLGLDASIKSLTDPSLRSLPIFAPYVGYQHYWSKSVRSTSTFGLVQLQNTAFEPGATFHKSTESTVNLIWNPAGSLNVGAECLYGWREQNGGLHANATRFQISGKYNFIRIKKTTN
jgi:hypothetical protein